MESKDILATDEFLTLLQNNKPKKIGEIRRGKYYLSTIKVDIECVLVTFDFDQNGCEDLFFFNNDELTFHVLSEKSYKERDWLFNKIELSQTLLTSKVLIELIVETYTAKELGF